MDRSIDLNALADYYTLRKALRWLETRLDLPTTVFKQVDVLNAEKCGLQGTTVCQGLV